MSPPHLRSAVLSFVLPGTGQLAQKRFTAFLVHLLLFGLFAPLPGLIIYQLLLYAPPNLLHVIMPVSPVMLLPVAMCLFSALDAACWVPGERSRMRRPMGWLVVAGVFVYITVFLVAQAYHNIRITPYRTVCMNNMRNVATALLAYKNSHGSFPPAYTVDESGRPMHSWRVLILEQLCEGKLADSIRLDEPWDSEHNRQFHSVRLSVFKCRAGEDSGMFGFLKTRFPGIFHGDQNCYYSVVVGDQTLFPGSRAIRNDEFTDDPAGTILLVERMFPVCWMDPTHEITFADASLGFNTHVYGPGSGHSGSCVTAFADGSVLAIPKNIAPETLKAMMTKAGGESVNKDEW